MVFPYLKGFSNNKVWFLLFCFVDLLCIPVFVVIIYSYLVLVLKKWCFSILFFYICFCSFVFSILDLNKWYGILSEKHPI
jgi:hypothetical protein